MFGERSLKAAAEQAAAEAMERFKGEATAYVTRVIRAEAITAATEKVRAAVAASLS